MKFNIDWGWMSNVRDGGLDDSQLVQKFGMYYDQTNKSPVVIDQTAVVIP